jgi:HSCB C-terminal oligomerisation domain
MVFVLRRLELHEHPLEEAATTEMGGEASLMGIMETREAIAETTDNSKLQEMWKNNEKPYLGKHLG